MSFRRPPALADWLLDRLCNTNQNAELAGDLLEEFRNGRSAAWYWRQTLRAIASGIAHNATVMRLYLLALGAAYAIQLTVVLALWSTHSPPASHATGWMSVGVYMLAQLTFSGCGRLVKHFVAGVSGADTKRMYCAVESATPRSTILALAAWESFYFGLASYCICALVFPRFSLAGLLGVEMTWFVLWVFTPALVPPSAPVTAAETVQEKVPFVATPELQPSLSVVLSNGTIVILDQQTLAQSVFAAADPELIAAVFREHRNLELLRRTIWLGACRNRSFTRGSAEKYTLAELSDLIDEVSHGAPALKSFNQSTRRERFRRRLRLTFRGDPA